MYFEFITGYPGCGKCGRGKDLVEFAEPLYAGVYLKLPILDTGLYTLKTLISLGFKGATPINVEIRGATICAYEFQPITAPEIDLLIVFVLT
jgi:hypothetical protein